MDLSTGLAAAFPDEVVAGVGDETAVGAMFVRLWSQVTLYASTISYRKKSQCFKCPFNPRNSRHHIFPTCDESTQYIRDPDPSTSYLLPLTRSFLGHLLQTCCCVTERRVVVRRGLSNAQQGDRLDGLDGPVAMSTQSACGTASCRCFPLRGQIRGFTRYGVDDGLLGC